MKTVAIIENSEGLGQQFTRFLDNGEYTIFPTWRTEELPDTSFDAFIFTGDYGNITSGLDPIYHKELELVAAAQAHGKKIFGSCFFHQLLGKVNGGAVGKRETRFLGWHRMTIENADTDVHPVLERLDDPYFLNLNVDEITVVPDSAKILVTNPDCRYQILQYGENILTCQSHPEVLKHEALRLIESHGDGLSDGCSDVAGTIARTKAYADDAASARFLSNLTDWLRS